MSNLFYDENWKLTLSNVNYNFSNDYGAFTGNGKLGCYNSLLYNILFLIKNIFL